MSLDEFKSTWAAELGDLSAARVTTLWKKSKTMSEKDVSAAISASRAAAAKDHARRGKPVHTDGQKIDVSPDALVPCDMTTASTNTILPLTSGVMPVPVAETEDAHVAESEDDPVAVEVDRRWSRICAPMGIDKITLTRVIKRLYEYIAAKDISDSDRAGRVNELYECVDRLLVLRHKYGGAVDVLKALGHT